MPTPSLPHAASRWPTERRPLGSAMLLIAALLAIYWLSLRGGYLNWDDPWLVSQNGFFLHPTPRGLWQIWTDFSVAVRYDLGAEYLPLRDTSFWLEAIFSRSSPTLSRAIQFCLYGAAILRLRSFLRIGTESSTAADIAIWVFALHPAHVEIVAWLSARKDVLSLYFCGTALDLYAQKPRRVLLIPALCALASLSKASSIVLPLLLLVTDLMLHRKPTWKTIVVSTVIAILIGGIQMRVGEVAGMLTGFAGGDRWSALFTEGTVLFRYLTLCVWPQSLSLIHDLRPELNWTWQALLGFGTVIAWLVTSIAFRQRRLLASWLLFVVPMLPTTNVLLPIQNLMADRYIALSLLGPCIVFSDLVMRIGKVPRWVVVNGALLCLGAISAYRARLFTSSVLVMQDAALHSPDSRRATFQLGKAYEEAGRPDDARKAYRDTLTRSAGVDEAVIRATIALARMEEARGDRTQALHLIEGALRRWPAEDRLQRRARRLNGTTTTWH